MRGYKNAHLPMAVVARCKARVCGCSLAGITGSNPAGVMDVLSPVSVVCCQVQSLRRADHPSGEVLLSVISKPETPGGLGPIGPTIQP